MKNIIIIPFAFIKDFESGANLSKKLDLQRIYLSNICVSAASSRARGVETAVVCNETPPEEYSHVLDSFGVKVIKVPFTTFNFPANYPWSLAFYKLCALKYVVENYDYDNYCYLDSDVFVQMDLTDLWKECEYKILAIQQGWTPTIDHNWQKEIDEFGYSNPCNRYTIHYGGEFLAASRINAKLFLQACETIYLDMINNKYITSFGDEFITSIALDMLENKVKNARAYIFRFWTRVFRMTTQHYRTHPVAILHVPSEKQYGMIKIYNKYVRKGKLPSNATAHKFLHLTRPTLEVFLKRQYYNLMVKLGRCEDKWNEFSLPIPQK